jgi:1-acyl-sn-glycerol-3-phosphate acyltransferase
MLSDEFRDILALCLFGVIGASLLGWIVTQLRKSPFSPVQSLLYCINYVIARVLWRARIDRPFPIPPDQGAVILCNHRCPLDPSFIALTVPRVVHWMVAREYCEQPLLGWLLRICGVIPVGRGGIDTAAVKSAIRLAAQGELVGLFPEGRINTSRAILLPGRPGAAMIAIKARVPVVPCFIQGAPYDGTTLGCLLMPASVRLSFGQPIDLSSYWDGAGGRQTLDDLTQCFLREIAKLGGDADFHPELAGRFYALTSQPNVVAPSVKSRRTEI